MKHAKIFNQMDTQIVILKRLSVLGLKRVAWPPPPENSVFSATDHPVYTKVICVFLTEDTKLSLCLTTMQ